MRLILVRHGEAYAGLHGVIAGPRGCAGLTPRGRRQAEALRDHLMSAGDLRADVLMASLLPRAIETARIIAPGLGFDTFAQDCDLCEVYTGEADGLAWSDYAARYGALDMPADPDRVFAPGGDSWNNFHARVQRMLERLSHDHADQTVVAVCHAGVIMASIQTIFDIPHPGTSARLQPSNTGLTEWEYEPSLDRWTLHTFNDVSHLRGLAAPTSGRDERVDDEPFSVEAAREAARHDQLDDWVAQFLSSPGSDNAALASQLCEQPLYWLGPMRLPFNRLNRLAGPEGEPVLCPVDDDEWGDNVDDMKDGIEEGWEPPPLIVSYRNGQLVLEDGNHRVESMRRAGAREGWAVVNFEDAEDRDNFAIPTTDQ